MTTPNASFHIAGCALAVEPDPRAIGDIVEWLQRYGASILSQDERHALFVRFDAVGGQLVLFGCRAAMARRPANLRFGYAAVVKEADAGGQPRAAERGLAQARDLAGAAQAGQVLLSSQLASLMQLSEIEPHERLRSVRVPFADGRIGSAFLVEPLRGASVET